MRNIKIFLSVLIFTYFLTSLLAYSLFARGAGTTTASFLKIGIGAKNMAMGGTGAVSEDVNSIYWNPAGLAHLSRAEISVMHAIWFQDINYEHLAIAYPGRFGTIGIGANYLSMKSIEKYDVNDVKLNETYKPYDMAGTISYARKLRIADFRLQMGGNIKYISSKLENESDWAVAVDIGGIYDELKVMGKKLKLGFAVQNLGTKMKFVSEEESLPLNIKAGCSYPAIVSSVHRLTVAVDVNKPSDNDVYGNVGTEYFCKLSQNASVAARVGYKTNTKGYNAIDGLSAGAGFVFQNYGLDFAWVPYGDLGNTFRFSLTALLGKAKTDDEAAAKPATPPAENRSEPVKTIEPLLPVKKLENYIAGKITREGDRPMFETVVKIMRGNNELARVYTDDNGNYQTDLLPVGKYTVKVWKFGYIAEVVEVEVKEDRPVKADFKLKRELKKK